MGLRSFLKSKADARWNLNDVNELIAEVMEDIALGHAIQEGENTKPVSKQEVLKLLDESKWLSDTC